MIDNLLCISPIDGRYHNYTKQLNNYFSEFALFKYRLLFEISYFLYLKENVNLDELKDLTNIDCSIIKTIYENFTLDDCIMIKNIEKKINHDLQKFLFKHRKSDNIIEHIDEYTEIINRNVPDKSPDNLYM